MNRKLSFSHQYKRIAIAIYLLLCVQACLPTSSPAPTSISTFKSPIRPVGTIALLKVIAERRGISALDIPIKVEFKIRYEITSVNGSIVTISTSSDDAPTDTFPYWVNKVFEFDVAEKKKLTPKEGTEYNLVSETQDTLTYSESKDWVNDSGFRFICSGTINRDASSGIMLSENNECDIYDMTDILVGKDKYVTTLISFQEP